MPSSDSPSTTSTPLTLGSAPLPPRVRQILQAVNTLASQSFSASLALTLNELEQQLFQQAERSQSSQQQTDRFVELQLLRRHRSDLIPRFLAGLERALARIKSPSTLEKSRLGGGAEPVQFQTLALVDDMDLDRHLVLNEIARRESIRNNNALLLLRQRFAVLAGSPALENEQLPVGPHMLCQILSDAGEALQMNLNSQLLLYRMFESQALSQYGEFADQLNTLLSDNGVLPGLVYQPYRRRESQRAADGNRPPHEKETASPMTGWGGSFNGNSWSHELLATLAASQTPPDTPDANASTPTPSANDSTENNPQSAAYRALRNMLARRNMASSNGQRTPHANDKTVDSPTSPANAATSTDTNPAETTPPTPSSILPRNTVLDVLSDLQPLAPIAPAGRLRTLADVQETTLAKIREQHGKTARLPQEQTDTFELLGMLYGEIGREIRRDAPAQDLLVRLQVPMARAAIADQSFFVRDQHPARELLNSVAESGAKWLSDDDADPVLVKKLESAVEQVVKEYDGDEKTFDRANREVQKYYRAQIRKAELSERRQIEAARGRDRLELARRRAAEVIKQQLRDRNPPEFIQLLLNLAWTDVLTLTLLRQGQDSESWKEYEKATTNIAQVVLAQEPKVDATLGGKIETALKQVGYHDNEAAAIARHLSSSTAAISEPDTEKELATRLQSRSKISDPIQQKKETRLPPRDAKEQSCYEQLAALPFGTWFEFVVNQQGDVKRLRLSWYSPVTGNALFVNQRGLRAGDHSLDGVARLMARNQVRIVTEDKSRLIDRAWQATLRALRSLAGKDPVLKNVEAHP